MNIRRVTPQKIEDVSLVSVLHVHSRLQRTPVTKCPPVLRKILRLYFYISQGIITAVYNLAI